MDKTTDLIVTLPFLLAGEAFIAFLVWRLSGGRLQAPLVVIPRGGHPRLAALTGVALVWLVVTATTIWCAFLVGFVAVHLLLFWLGAAAAWLGVIILGGLLLATPFAWGWLALRAVRVRY